MKRTIRVSKRRREAEALLDESLLAVVHIACEQCGKKDSLSTLTGDTEEAASFFYDEGWRSVNEKVLCGRCQRKKK